MARKLRFHSLHFLFRLFAYLADKSGGWYVFVKPKLIIGAMILSVNVLPVSKAAAQNNKSKPTPTNKKQSSDLHKTTTRDSNTLCYDVVVAQPDTAKIYEVVEQMPKFPGGEVELLTFISKAMIHQPMAQCYNGIQGSVIVRFVVEKDGSVTHVEVIRSLDRACDKEAVRIIKTLPRWIPGKHKGKNVRVYYTLPVRFSLE